VRDYFWWAKYSMSTAASAASTFSGHGQAPAWPRPPWRSLPVNFKKLYHGGHRGKTGGHGFISKRTVVSVCIRVLSGSVFRANSSCPTLRSLKRFDRSGSHRASRGPRTRQKDLDRRCDDERQQHGNQDAANDGDRQWLKHLRSGAERERKWQHAGHGRQRRHHDGPEPSSTRLDRGFFRRKSNRAELLVCVEQ